MSGKPETEFVRQIRDYLHLRGAVTTRVNSGLKILQNEDGSNRRVMRGAEAGTADIIGCYRGRYFAIEAKVGKNKATDKQNEFIQQVQEAGGIAFVAWTLDDIDKNFDWEIYR